MQVLDTIDKHLLNDFQQEFPLQSRPYQHLGQRLGISEEEVISRVGRLQDEGYISRVGAVFTPGKVGASVLAAMEVAPQEIENVASIINEFDGVNHNYEREHAFNLWFVVTAPDEASLAAILASMREKTGLDIMELPLLEPFHLDLGFELQWN